MLLTNLWRRLTRPDGSGDLEELRRDTILEVGVGVFALGWLFMVAAYAQAERAPLAFILTFGSLSAIWLRQHHVRVALAELIVTLVAAIASQQWLFPASLAQYFYPVVVVVSSLLVPSVFIFVVAGVVGATCLAVAFLQGISWLDSQQVVTPIVLTGIVAAAAWVGSRQMHLALEWMSASYTRVNRLLEQLRDERAWLAHSLKMLEDAYVRIEKMNYALIEARSAAEEARRLKAEFAANISHELRTPLNLVIGFSETMANAPETDRDVTWSPTLRGDVEQIYRSSRHLAALIDDILDLSALDARHLGLTMEERDLAEVVREAVAVLQDLFRAKRLYLDVVVEPGLPRVRMDVVRIRQVLINLLTNASRFTQQGGVTITVGRVQEVVRVSVADTGIGIAPEDIPKVFIEFGQVDGSTARKHEGTGLGVPLSKRLIELHHGTMWLESRVGFGTTFYFTLPILAESDPAYASFTPYARDVAYRKALLVLESDPWLLRTSRRHLAGYDVIAAPHAEELAALIAQHQPIAVLTDREDANVRARVPADLPVISLTLSRAARSARVLGVQNHLIKPIFREPLLEAITELAQPARDILIVDDDAQFVELVSRMLQSAGYHPIKALGGAEALERLRQEPVDLVLLDMLMPQVDGVQVLGEMRAKPALADIPVIVISGQSAEEVGAEGLLRLELTCATGATTTEALNYLEQFRHHHIQRDRVGPMDDGEPQRFFAAIGVDDFIVVRREVAFEKLVDAPVVVNDEDARLAGARQHQSNLAQPLGEGFQLERYALLSEQQLRGLPILARRQRRRSLSLQDDLDLFTLLRGLDDDPVLLGVNERAEQFVQSLSRQGRVHKHGREGRGEIEFERHGAPVQQGLEHPERIVQQSAQFAALARHRPPAQFVFQVLRRVRFRGRGRASAFLAEQRGERVQPFMQLALQLAQTDTQLLLGLHERHALHVA
ncbi:MAG: response regulator [Chloroflexi bacterium]|nr:response regulator [Chloroflexota bacterium]